MINPRILAVLVMAGFIAFFLFGGGLIFPKKNTEINITPTLTPIIIEKYIEVLVTPTVDGRVYYASEYQNGTRLLKRPFSFVRYNVEGLKDMKITTMVYDYRMFEELHYFEYTNYKYVEITPTEPNSKFLFIFVRMTMDDITGDDVKLWIVDRNKFAVFDGNNTYYPKEYPYFYRFHEIENVGTFDKSTYVQDFKSLRLYSRDLEYKATAGIYAKELYWLYSGESNSLDGYILYEIPKEASAENIVVMTNLHAFGNSNWRLEGWLKNFYPLQ